MFIGRRKELKRLEDHIKLETPTLVAIIGRRGVGKTSLINEMTANLPKEFLLYSFKGNKKVSTKNQMKYFLADCKDLFKYEEVEEILMWGNWDFLFGKLAEKIKLENDQKNRKMIFVIDEFAWFHIKGSDFVQSFSSFWNKIASLKNIHFYITGSAIAWMNKNVINTAGGLHGRVTETINLKAFDFLETALYLYKTNHQINLETYLLYYILTGGVPRYLSRLRSFLTDYENAKRIFTNEGSVNFSEFDELFKSSFESSLDVHKKIVELFKEKRKYTAVEIEEILKNKYKISRATIYNGLHDLSVSQILTLQKQHGKENDGYYSLTDLFSYSYLKIFKEKVTQNNFESHRSTIMKGYAFEIVALLNAHLIKEELSRNGFETNECTWQNKNAQIDLVIDYQNDKWFTIVECKNVNNEFKMTQEYAKEIRNKVEEFMKYKNNSVVDVVLFTTYGSKNKESNLIYQDVILERIMKRFLKNFED